MKVWSGTGLSGIGEAILPSYIFRQQQGTTSTSTIRPPTTTTIRPPTVSSTVLSSIANAPAIVFKVMQRLSEIIDFPDYEKFLANPIIKIQATTAFGQKLPSFAYLQQFSESPIYLPRPAIDYYRLPDRILDEIGQSIIGDGEKIYNYKFEVQDAQSELHAYSKFLFSAATVTEKYIHLALQVLKLFETILNNGIEVVFGSLLDTLNDEIDRRSRETEGQREVRAEWDNEEEKKQLEGESAYNKVKWGKMLVCELATVEETYLLWIKELEAQLREHYDLLVSKYTDDLNTAIIKADGQYKDKELQCDKDNLEANRVENRRSSELLAQAEQRRQYTVAKITQYRQVSKMIADTVSDISSGNINVVLINTAITRIKSFMAMEQQSRQISSDNSQDYSKVEDLPSKAPEITDDQVIGFFDLTTSSKTIADGQFYTGG